MASISRAFLIYYDALLMYNSSRRYADAHLSISIHHVQHSMLMCRLQQSSCNSKTKCTQHACSQHRCTTHGGITSLRCSTTRRSRTSRSPLCRRSRALSCCRSSRTHGHTTRRLGVLRPRSHHNRQIYTRCIIACQCSGSHVVVHSVRIVRIGR